MPDAKSEQTVTGYQYGDDRSYIGPYTFPITPGQAPHLPPKTMLEAPPTNLPIGKEAAANAAGDGWLVRNEDLSWMDEDSRQSVLAARAGGPE